MTPAAAATVVVELTPAGRAAVAVVLVAGPEAVRAVSHNFAPDSGRSFVEVPVDVIVLGRWGGPNGEQLIACRRGDDRIEVHCHGGLAAVRSVIDSLIRGGCTQISWQEWLLRASPDPLRAAAHIALAHAPTTRTAAVLLDQYDGALTIAIQSAIASIGAADWSAGIKAVDGLLQLRDFGLHLTTPWRVVLAGAPNVGKSSLINALAGYQRAIISPLPGTTRDVVTLTTAIDGWPVQLADTAGLRATDDELESAGVALAGAAIADADLVIVVSDASLGADTAPETLSRIPKGARVLPVWNKIDVARLAHLDGRHVSALTGAGIAELIAEIGHLLVPVAPPAGTPVAFSAEQFAQLSAARLAIDARDPEVAMSALKALLSTPRGAV